VPYITDLATTQSANRTFMLRAARVIAHAAPNSADRDHKGY